ncbi:hypothetical protein [Limimaricola hongkongensis]|uniref:Uncharacterized protein n=1 Tax=Limimaricola hongkongensis DSM 17492 TaxID=1122180 RepID=A0A017H8E5_9RHOB|nr:hypothetical protein [Limimaricola hongkongensis]EYD70550.1 hypothetical protein Lokhon_02184 [Limimaricola hongkongensis DSM 17492]
MTDTPPATLTRESLDMLRSSSLSGEIVPEAEIVPGLRFVPDPDAGMRGRFSSPAGRLLEIELTHERPARWCGLHIRLDVGDLSGLGIVGLSARFAAPHAIAVAPCLRSGTETGFADCFFAKQVAALPRPLLHLDALETDGRHDALPPAAPWREIVLFLPTGDVRLDLHDLRIFAA